MEPQLLTVIDKEDLKQWAPSEWPNWQFEAKHDGVRCLIVNGVPQSRTGKPLNNLGAVLKEIGQRANGAVLDGEIVGESWADTMHNARASEGKRNEDALSFKVFDMLTIQEWKHQKCDRDLSDRQSLLWDYINPSAHVQLIAPILLKNYSAFEGYYRLCLGAGCDGVVLKLRHSMYEFKRTKTWLKVKPEHTVDGVVVATRVGKLKYSGTLGALVFQPEGVSQITNVSGMTDAQRDAWWKNPKLIVGKMIEVKCRGVHPTGKLIEPRFVRIREDK